MEIKTLWAADSRRHRGSLAGISVLVFLVSLSLVSAMAVWRNSGQYLRSEMERLGFGTITAWVSGIDEIGTLTEEINRLSEVEKTGVQPIIFSEYETHGQESDSEGQLVTYEPERYPYKIFLDDLKGYRQEAIRINPGEIYVSPSLSSMFGVKVGDEISFPIARNGGRKEFTVKGWFEDPFMGSSMIGMKSFLICGEDHDEIARVIESTGIDALARDGYMMHIFGEMSQGLSAAQLNGVLNHDTELLRYGEFTHSDSAIYEFMMTLQNVFTGILMAFVLVMVFVCLVVMAHSISSSQEQDMGDTGILKTIGFTTEKLQIIQVLLYLVPVFLGMAAGVLAAVFAAFGVSRMTIFTTGLLVPAGIPFGVCLPVLLLVSGIFMGFVWLKTAGIEKITPMKAIRGMDGNEGVGRAGYFPIRQEGLCFWLALRQVVSGKKRYAGACIVAALLAFFMSLMGRVNSWLGAAGKGLMDAFNPADLHIAAQPMGKTTSEDIEKMISGYTRITGQYMLAMPSVSLEGVDYTANVITEPERFHMLRGQTCLAADEIVVTEMAAADLNVDIGDLVLVGAGLGTLEYRVSGIYQCANDMGANVGLSREGYSRIGRETKNMWCVHYFIENTDMQPEIMEVLKAAYGGDVYLHENSWPGLYGILSAMELLMCFMYGIGAVLIFVITALTGSKLLGAEQKDMGIYRSFGLSAEHLRISFALRFFIVSLVGAGAGTAASVLLTDLLAGGFLRLFGISNFSSHLIVGNTVVIVAAVAGAFTVFAWFVSGRNRSDRLTVLVN